MALAAGMRLGPYEVTGAIGAGGMGEVYRARDTRLDRTVAIKVLPDQLHSRCPGQRMRAIHSGRLTGAGSDSFSGGKLKIADLGGGTVIALADAPDARGGTWNKDDLIIFAPSYAGSLMQVPAIGGLPAPLTELDSARRETSHRWPYGCRELDRHDPTDLSFRHVHRSRFFVMRVTVRRRKAPSNGGSRRSRCAMIHANASPTLRCQTCGRPYTQADKFCAECGHFLRDPYIDQRLLLALVQERDGHINDARQELQRLLQSEPDHVLANHALGTLYFHEGLMDLAILHFRKALSAAPNFVLGHYDLGVAAYHRGDMPAAIQALRRCLELDPHYNAAHYRLALALYHSGQLEQALRHFEDSVMLTPEYLMAHYHIGVIHERLGNLDKAERAFERSMEETLGDVSSLYHLATIRRAKGDVHGAEEFLRRAREFDRTAAAV